MHHHISTEYMSTEVHYNLPALILLLYFRPDWLVGYGEAEAIDGEY